MIFIKSLLFSILILLTSIPLAISFLVFYPLFFLDRRKLFDLVSIYWSKYIIFVLKHICRIDSKVIGFEKLNKNKQYLIVGKHESLWESFMLNTFIKPAPAFIIKEEMLRVPFFGWNYSNATNIPIDRKAGLTSLKKIIRKSKEFVKEGRNIIIFAQGTRVPYNSSAKDYPYKVGFAVLAKELGIDIVPMALNSGKLWGKKQFLKYPGTITMDFLKPIKYKNIKGLNNKDLVKKIEDKIENRCKELNKL